MKKKVLLDYKEGKKEETKLHDNIYKQKESIINVNTGISKEE